MGLRRQARECALHILFAIDVCNMELKEAQESFWRSRKVASEVLEFATTLVEGTRKNLSEIDSMITPCAKNWDLERMSAIDRNIIRQATYEIFYLPEIPFNVSINEAIELAKDYSTEESGKFVNGIIDEIKGKGKCRKEKRLKK